MFSRSEKTEEVAEALAEPAGQRSPMVLAALAGLLAIAGAFLLIFYLNGNNDDDTALDNGTSQPALTSQATRQVLVVIERIPSGTSARELISAPTQYLSARALPEEAVAGSALGSIAELQELDGLALSSDLLPGEQVLRGRFVDLGTFDGSSSINESLGEKVDVPPNHHAVVVTLPASAALGGFLNPGDNVTVVGAFDYQVADAEGRQGARKEISVVVLNSVEVLSVKTNSEQVGLVTIDAASGGPANQGPYTVILAVEPEELTDLTYAMQYGEITLAGAIPGLDGEAPRAATQIEHVLGDDGVWVAELEDGDLIDLLGFPEFTAGSSDFDFPAPEDNEPQANPEANAPDEAAVPIGSDDEGIERPSDDPDVNEEVSPDEGDLSDS